MIDQNDEVFLLFLEESQEHLEDIESDLLELESQQDNLDDELLNKVFRAVHTVKGGSGFFGLTKIQSLAHSMENILGLIRTHDLQISSEIVSILLNGADKLSSMINSPESMDEVEVESVISELDLFDFNRKQEASLLVSQPSSVNSEINISFENGPIIFTISEQEVISAQTADGGGQYVYLIKYDLYKDIEEKGRTPQQVVKEFLQLTFFLDSFTDYSQLGTLESSSERMDLPFYVLVSTVMDPLIMSEFIGLPPENIVVVYDALVTKRESRPIATPSEPLESEIVKSSNFIQSSEQTDTKNTEVIEPPKEIIKEPTKKQTTKSAKATKKSKAESRASVRIPVAQLEVLMSLAGELVLTRNELLQKVQNLNTSDINDAAQRVDSITSELQEAIMVTRMQPVGTVFNKFKRIVHDMSISLGKEIDFIVEGEEVELDRSIIEAIGDPLTHMVRNSIDHGVETPIQRSEAGKDSNGLIKLSAQHQAGQVIIAIEDNGRGIDPNIISKIAVKKGVVTEDQISVMSEKDIVKLIFAPGFSTAEKVTDISGRGVGMDVVMNSFTKVGGVVDISSFVGVGTTMTVKLPLTLAIIPSLLLKAEGERFAIPQTNLVELVRINPEKVQEKIERVGKAAVLRLRGELLPLVKLTTLLEMPQTFLDPETGIRHIDNRDNIADRRSPSLTDEELNIDLRPGRRKSDMSAVNIAIVSAGNNQYGIIVDALLDSEEIVVKPLGTHLSSCKYYAGATILGDGNVATILDIQSIYENSIVKTASMMVRENLTNQNAKEAKDVSNFLLFRNNENETLALPMVLVTRIEKVANSDLMVIGDKRAIQYRGDTLLILNMNDLGSVGKLEERDFYNIIVFQIKGHEYGLIVGEVQDVIQHGGEIDGQTYAQLGIMGTFIEDEKLIMLIDLYNLANELLPEIQNTEAEENTQNQLKSILVVEDSMFFLHQIEKLLKDLGYNIYTAMNGAEGIDALKANSDISLILTDIEMPVMNGLEMTRKIRSMDQYKEIPMVAITSLSSEEDEKNGLLAGINEYLIKMDKEQIIDVCQKMLA